MDPELPLIIKEIEDGEIREFSAVDEPATGLPFTFFKSAKQGTDFPGIGEGSTDASPSGGRAPGLVDLERCLRENPDASPGECEAMMEAEGFAEALAADMAGDDATISDPATAGNFETAKTEVYMPTKQEEGLELEPELVAAEPPAATAPVVEIETSAVEWPMEQCIADAKQQLGVGNEGAATVCSMIYSELGDMEDEDSILVPNGLTTETLLTEAALTAGIAKPAGRGGGEGSPESVASAPEKRRKFTFTGVNRWWRSTKDRLGMNRPKTPERKRLERLEGEIGNVTKSIKSKDDLIRYLLGHNRMLSRHVGLDTSDLDSFVASFGGGAEPAPEPVSEPEAAAEEKRRKDAAVLAATMPAPAAAPIQMPAIVTPVAAPATPEEELAALRAQNAALIEEKQRMLELLGTGSDATLPATPLAPAALATPQPFPVVAGTPAAGEFMGPAGDPSTPLEGIALIPAPLGASMVVDSLNAPKRAVDPAQRKSLAPEGNGGNGGLVVSSILGGAYIPADDRAAFHKPRR